MNDFCQGSIVRISWTDPKLNFSQNSYFLKNIRFSGIVVKKSHFDQRMGARVTLRNVIDGEPIEITIPLYAAHVKEVTVLKHSYLNEEQISMLRQLPSEYSRVSDKSSGSYTERPRMVELQSDKVGEIHRILREKLDAINMPIGKRRRNRALNTGDRSLFYAKKWLWPHFRRLTKEELAKNDILDRYRASTQKSNKK